ncbi:MAG: hypothetical protein WC023_02615 [Rhodocyclaceae bacterium]
MKIKPVLAAISTALLLAVSVPAAAGDDHGEAPAGDTGKALPSVTAVSESYELVGRLGHDELAILIDRAATTAPVLDAVLTVELDGRSAAAPFHADHGDYSLTDAEMLGKLRQVGSKTLVFTLIVGDESDLLTGELDVHDAAPVVDVSRHGGREYAVWIVAALAGLALLTLLLRRLRAARNPHAGGAA